MQICVEYPKESEIIHDMDKFFNGCNNCEKQVTHICESDLFFEEISSKYIDYLVELETNKNNEELLTDKDFSDSMILKFINEMSNTSSTGPDGLPGKMIKEGRIVIILGKQSVDEGKFPKRLKNMFVLGFH